MAENLFVVGYNILSFEWVFDSTKDLKLIGIVCEKFYYNDTTNVFFKVKIQEMNKDSISGLINAKGAGEIVKLSLKSLKFEIVK